MMESLARVLPADVAVVEEAVTTTNTDVRTTRRAAEYERLFCPSRLGARLGLGLFAGSQAGLARAAGVGPVGRGCSHVWHPGRSGRRPTTAWA